VATGQSFETLYGHADFVNSAAFSPDAKRIVTSSNDNTARTWRCDLCGMPVPQLITLARERLKAH
jgi:WD40 repeat protein